MTSSTSPSNVGLKVCTLAHFLHAPWAFEIYLEFLKFFMSLAQIPSQQTTRSAGTAMPGVGAQQQDAGAAGGQDRG